MLGGWIILSLRGMFHFIRDGVIAMSPICEAPVFLIVFIIKLARKANIQGVYATRIAIV